MHCAVLIKGSHTPTAILTVPAAIKIEVQPPPVLLVSRYGTDTSDPAAWLAGGETLSHRCSS